MDKETLRHVVMFSKTVDSSYSGTAEELTSELIALSNSVSMQQPEDLASGTSYIRLRTYAGGKPAPAQVKVFSSFQNVGGSWEVLQDEVIDFIRFQTDEKGEGLFPLPAGRSFLLKIDKGIIYSTVYVSISVQAGETVDICAKLSLLVDLKGRGIYLGDLHHHSVYSSPLHGGTDNVIDTPEDVKLSMMASGLNYGALSDHHNILNHSEWHSLSSEDFTAILSKEISTSGGHVAAHGVDEDIIFDIPNEWQRTDEYLRSEFIRVVDEIKKKGGLAQLNHPYTFQEATSFPERFYDIACVFDTIEIWNGHLPFMPGFPNELAFRMWLSLLKSGCKSMAVCGSDTHKIQADDYHNFTNGLRKLCEGLTSDMCDSFKQTTDLILELKKHLIPAFEIWGEQTFGTGGVVNLTFVDGKPTERNLLDSLKKGKNILTNGPVLIPSINGKYPGETAVFSGETIRLDIDLVTKRVLEKLVVYTMSDEYMQVTEVCRKDGEMYNYSTNMVINVQKNDFVVLVAYGGSANLAIANPIFVAERV